MSDDYATILFKSIKGYVDARVDALRNELAPHQDSATIRRMAFYGSFDPALTYPPGAVVQRALGLYIALISTTEPPGSSGHWRRIAALPEQP